jgi:cytochrome c peroxidase
MKFIFVFILFYTNYIYAQELIKPIPLKVDYDKQKAKLGRMLFSDARLSSDDTISCESCHSLYNYGVDSLSVSFGVDDRKGIRNSPSVYNSRFNFVQFWDGKVNTLKEQAIMPMLNSFEMNADLKETIKKLKDDLHYVKYFKEIYNDDIKIEYITDALSEFEKSLITPNSKFDKYLRGDKNALNENEKEGYKLFKSYGCISCHNGINIGGNLFQKLGYFADFHDPKRDMGLYHVTNNEKDKDFFKVPSLRNVEMTAPYFHNGNTKTLKEAVQKMTVFQLGRIINDNETEKIVDFLKTLTGKPQYEE